MSICCAPEEEAQNRDGGVMVKRDSEAGAPVSEMNRRTSIIDPQTFDFVEAVNLDYTGIKNIRQEESGRRRGSLTGWLAGGLFSKISTGTTGSRGFGEVAPETGSNSGSRRNSSSSVNPRYVVKLLMCGSGESGKSTVVKQMKIIHGGGFTTEETADYRAQIWREIHASLVFVLSKLESHQLSRDDRTLETFWQVRRFKPDFEGLVCLPAEYVEAASFLWVELVRSSFDEIVRRGYARESCAYFLDNLARIGSADYTPTNEDILMARITTVGINEYAFRMDSLLVRMVDVGGQRPEREKWIEAFDGVTALVFCVALSEYDQTLVEDPAQNRLLEAYELWSAVVNSRWFSNVSILLFLNKKDIFRNKLLTSPFGRYHPEYTCSLTNPSAEDVYQHVSEYIMSRFLRLNYGKAKVYPYFTCATDTRNIASIFAAVKETVLANNLKTAGLM